ncbi:anti-sigma factor [soil metagenome]
MNIRENERLLEKLASEYVLGTLRAGARRRFEKIMLNDMLVRRAVAEWQDRLHPMAQFAPAAQPSSQVWQAIARRLNLQLDSSSDQHSFWQRLRDNLGFWRGLGVASTAMATLLVAVLLSKQPDSALPVTNYVALLADDKAQPVAYITGDTQRRQLTIKLVGQPNLARDKSLELWAVPKEGAPRSLGLLADNGSVTLPLPANVTPQSIPLLAISLEPKGGSRNPNGPSGPILFKGAWLQI